MVLHTLNNEEFGNKDAFLTGLMFDKYRVNGY